MKYTFEVITYENENVIKIDISFNNISNNVTKILSFKGGEDDENESLDRILDDMIDNMRLTVKEREDAKYNAKVLKWYIQQYRVNANKVRQQMIVENGNPSVLGDPDKYIK